VGSARGQTGGQTGVRAHLVVSGRRTDVMRESDITTISDETALFGYNTSDELTDVDRYEGASLDPLGDPITSYGEFDFDYDNIGNRETYDVDISQQSPTTVSKRGRS